MRSTNQTQLVILATTAALALIALVSRRTRLLSLCPFVASRDNFIIARTSRVAQVLSLGLFSRLVIIDGRKKAITVRSRSFWFFRKTRKVRFAFVRQVLYGLADWNPATALGLTGDSFEVYAVGLRLVDDEVVHLCRFLGDGTFRCGWDVPKVLRWTYFLDRLTDLSGTQEEDSRAFLDRLARLLNVGIGRY